VRSSVTVFQTDAAGNVGPSSTVNLFLDRVVPNKPSITSIPAASDNWINLRDARDVGVTVLVSLLNTGAVVDDWVVIGGFTQEFEYRVTQKNITDGFASVTLSSEAVLQDPAAGPSLRRSITARIEDQGGNVSALSDSVLVNVDTNIQAPLVDTTRGAAKGISKSQAKSPVDFFGSGVELDAQVSVFFTGVLGSTLLSTTTGQPGGSYKVTLQPNDMASLGDGLVSYRVVQTDTALNTSVEQIGSFDLRLSTPLPTLLDVTEDNVVSASEANGTVVYQGLGVAGASVKVNFFVRGDDVVYKTTPEIAQKTTTVLPNGFWSVNLSATDFTNLSKRARARCRITATQTDDGSESGVADLEFYVDRLPPALSTSPNLLTFTEVFDNVAWGKSNVLVRPDRIAAPLAPNAQTADAVVPNAGNLNNAVFQDVAVVQGQTYTYSGLREERYLGDQVAGADHLGGLYPAPVV